MRLNWVVRDSYGLGFLHKSRRIVSGGIYEYRWSGSPSRLVEEGREIFVEGGRGGYQYRGLSQMKAGKGFVIR